MSASVNNVTITQTNVCGVGNSNQPMPMASRLSWIVPVSVLTLAQLAVITFLGTRMPGPPLVALVDLAFNLLCIRVCWQASRRSNCLARYFWLVAVFSVSVFCVSFLLNLYVYLINPSQSVAQMADVISVFWFGPVSLMLFLEPDFEPTRFDRIHILDFLHVILFMIAIYIFFLYLPTHETSGSVFAHTWVRSKWAGSLVYDGAMAVVFLLRSALTDSRVVRSLFGRTGLFLFFVCLGDFYYNFLGASLEQGSWYEIVWTLLNIAPIVLAGTWNKSETLKPEQRPLTSDLVGNRMFPILYAFLVLLLSMCIVREHIFFALAMVSVSFICSSLRLIIIQQRERRTAMKLQAEIAERKRAEERLQEHKEHLEDEVAQRTEQLVEANTQLRQAQKMEALGRLAGGVAHDFNNLLTVITGYSSLLHDAWVSDPESLEKVDQIYKAGERASELTQQLLAFSRRQILQRRVVNLNEILADCEKMLRRILGEDIELKTFTDPALESIRADPGQISQVIVNLAVNARDAMPHGGRLTLTTASAGWEEIYSRLGHEVQSGPYVELTVSDTGCGMDAETQAHIFEPFFTTKKQGKGTGLGLATVYGIVEQNGGHIWVRSEPGRGTTFHVYLPQFAGDTASDPHPRAQGQTGGSETILVVEDQEGVRTLVCEVLLKTGYKVLPAADGREAVSLLEKYRGRIDLMLTDLVMPHMGGQQLAKALRSVRPESKVLYMSGYTDKASQNEIAACGIAFIQKPFTPDALARRVREVLDAPKISGSESVGAL